MGQNPDALGPSVQVPQNSSYSWMFLPPSHLVKDPYSHHFFKQPAAEEAKRQDHRMHQPSQLEAKAHAGAIQTMGPHDVEAQHWQDDVVHRHLGAGLAGGQGRGGLHQTTFNILPHQKLLLLSTVYIFIYMIIHAYSI